MLMWGIYLEQFEDSSVKTIMGNRLECYYAFPERKANQYYPSLFYDRINRLPARGGTWNAIKRRE